MTGGATIELAEVGELVYIQVTYHQHHIYKTSDLMNELNILKSAILQAGHAIKEIQRTGYDTTTKQNSDPLTTADLLANQILKDQITSAFPNDGWLSEETVDNPDRLNCKRVWIVDPIDGTKEFIKNIPEYAISVALVENHLPILAAIYNPLTDELFHAEIGKGLWLNDQPVRCSLPNSEKLIILASRTEFEKGAWEPFMGECEIKPIGSIAYKLALLAAGKAHATFSLGPKSEWDIAAGVLLVQEGGGLVTDKYKKSFVFNQPSILVNSIVATTRDCHERVHALINHHATLR